MVVAKIEGVPATVVRTSLAGEVLGMDGQKELKGIETNEVVVHTRLDAVHGKAGR